MNHHESMARVPENTGYKNDLGELERAFVDAYEVAMTAHFYVKMVWVGVDGDPGLKAGVAAVAAVIAERQRARWSELIDQAPTTRAVSVHGQRFDVAPEVPVFATTDEAMLGAASVARRYEAAILGLNGGNS